MTTIYTNGTTPYGRKVRILAIELGLEQSLTWETIVPWTDASIYTVNPVGRVPVMALSDGAVITESFNICEELLAMAAASGQAELAERILPTERGAARRKCLQEHGLASGLLEVGIGRYRELNQRPEEHQMATWIDRYERGLRQTLEALNLLAERRAFDDPVSFGAISVASAYGWIAFRHSDLAPGKIAPALADVFDDMSKRPSFQATVPNP